MVVLRNTSFGTVFALYLSPLAHDTSGKLDVLRHNRNSLGVNGAEVGVFEKSDKICFRSFLEGEDGGALEAQISLEVLGDFSDEALERQFTDQKLGGLLVLANLAERDRSRAVAVRLLHTT